MAPGSDSFDRAVRLYKEGLDGADPDPLIRFFDGLAPEGRKELASSLTPFLEAERARLVKLKTLGQSRDFEPRIRMTEALIARTRRPALTWTFSTRMPAAANARGAASGSSNSTAA